MLESLKLMPLPHSPFCYYSSFYLPSGSWWLQVIYQIDRVGQTHGQYYSELKEEREKLPRNEAPNPHHTQKINKEKKKRTQKEKRERIGNKKKEEKGKIKQKQEKEYLLVLFIFSWSPLC